MEAEGVSAVDADVLCVAVACPQESDRMAGQNADGRVSDLVDEAVILEERMTAEACIFSESVPQGDLADSMAEQAAQVTDLLPERRAPRIRIAVGLEQQRVTALRADVFMMPIAPGQWLVGVSTKEARQGVPDMSQRFVFTQVTRAATASTVLIRRGAEYMVVDMMSK